MAGAAGAGLGVALVAAGPSLAADFSVTNLDDSGPGSLRSAIDQANASPDADRILFQSGLSGSIVLQTPLEVTETLNIEGPTDQGIAIDGDEQTGILIVGNQVGPVGFTVSDLTFQNGNSYDAPSGAITASDTDLFVEGVDFENNIGSAGGAIYAGYGSGVTVLRSTFSGNRGTVGGGIFLEDSAADVRYSTFSENQSIQGGGAIASYATPENSQLDIINSTMNRNSGGFVGGAIFGFAGQDAVGSLFINSSTISGNLTSGAGGGIGGSFADAEIKNSVVENNFAFYGPDLYSAIDEDPQLPGCGCYPETTFDTSFSFIGSTAGSKINSTVAGSNILNGGDALLGRLADNGGPTETMAIGPESPVVNQGGPILQRDQRGETRPVIYPGIPLSGAVGANGSDMGAYELQYVEPPPPIPPNGPFVILGSKPDRKTGTAVVSVKVPAPGEVTLVGYKRLKTVSKRASAKGVYRFRATPKGSLKKNLNKRGRARVVVRFNYNPDQGRTLAKGRMFPLFKGNKRK